MTEAPDQFQTLIGRLRDDPALANLLKGDPAVLIWDAAGETLLWTSPAAADFGRSLIDERRMLTAGSRARTRLAALAGGVAPFQGVRLERLLLDPARLSPPVTCACRLAETPGGERVLVAIIVGAVPKVRQLSVSAAVAPPPVAERQPPAGQVRNVRFVWQTDADTRFIHVSLGLAEAVGPKAADILGRSWDEVSRSLVDDQAGIAELFAQRATWSGRQIAWSVDNTAEKVAAEWAGMPVYGADRDLVGFRGFGLVRAQALPVIAAEPDMAAGSLRETEVDAVLLPRLSPQEPETPSEREESQDVEEPAREHQEAQEAEPVDEAESDEIVIDSEPVMPMAWEQANDVPMAEREMTEEEKLFEQLRETVAASLSEPTIEIYGRAEPDEAQAEPDFENETYLAPQPPQQPPEPPSGLSTTERHAFREIARALGARVDLDQESERPARTSEKVVPFRGLSIVPDTAPEPEEPEVPVEVVSTAEPVPSAAPPDVEPVVAAATESPPARPVDDGDGEAGQESPIDGRVLLSSLPLPALVHQGEHVVFANPALLALSGYDDREHLAAAGGLPRLFGGLASGSSLNATLTTRARATIPVQLDRASVSWEGVGAEWLIVRPSSEAGASQRLQAADEELRARNVRVHELESVLDTATDGVIVLDETGRILSLNRSAEALFGYNQNEVVGDAITVLLSPESHIVALDYIEGLRSPGVASLLNDGREVMGRVRQGGAIPLFMTMGHVNDGPEHKLCAVLRDITPFKKAEGELVGARRAAEHANAQKSDLLAKISHEIRTPLNAILGFAEVMLEERFGPIGNDRYKEYLKDVHASGAHVISLVNDLLDLAKVEAGRMDLSFTSVNLNDLVSGCFTLLQPQAARDRIVMRTSFATKLPPVVADDRSVRQIVLNLVSNAIKFTDAGGQVIVSTALTDRGEVAFRVRDTGIGMNEEEVEAALEPFRQLATSRKRGGTGLGLPLTKALVEANRGALQISSQPNEGTLVEVIFPPTRVLAE